ATYTIQTSASGAPQMISLGISGLPPGVTSATFNPQTLLAGDSSILTLTTDPSSPGVSGSFTVTGVYPGGSPGSSAVAGISISAPPPPPPPSLPPVSTLVDSFGGNSINSSLWSVSAVAGTAVERAGSLRLSPNNWTASSQIAVDSKAAYSLIGSGASVK